jgi:outer membrane protein OmpA-like peptidoglycan-associated protein/predicted  nucleic acid-binding Zn-ribbon protein
MLAMVNTSAARWLKCSWRLSGVLSVVLPLEAGQLAAEPLVEQLPPGERRSLTDGGAVGSLNSPADRSDTAESSPFAELNKALIDGQAKLAEFEKVLDTVTALAEELSTVRDENQQLGADLQASRAAQKRSDEIAQVRIADLRRALNEFEAREKRHAQELAEMREKHGTVTTDLTHMRTQHDEAKAEAERARADLIARIDQLMADAEASAAKAQRLRKELSDAQENVAIAANARNEAQARAGDLQKALDGMSSEIARQSDHLAATTERLNNTEGALALLEQERKDLVDQLRLRQAKADGLNGQLATARQDLANREAAISDLAARLASFETAAATATDAATQTLHAVEAQLATLSSVLVLSPGELAQGSIEVVATSPGENGDAAPTISDRPNGAIPETVLRDPAPGAGPDQPTTSRFAMLMMPGQAMMPLAKMTTGLSIEHQIQAHNLLVDLEAKPDPEGIKMIVPGMELFASNSDAIQDAAHARLSQVAELLQLYQRQPILILGHTDAVGDRENNVKLSERRAEAVKRFFIDHFGIEASRLSSRGMGEQQPVASNATVDGREANRRVEVLILN